MTTPRTRLQIPTPLLYGTMIVLAWGFNVGQGLVTSSIPISATQLAHTTSLSHCVRIYIPGKMEEQPVPELQTLWTERAITMMSSSFGGATVIHAEGAWQDGETVVREPVVIVYSHATESAFRQHSGDVIRLANQLRSSMCQSAVAVEIDGILHLVDGSE